MTDTPLDRLHRMHRQATNSIEAEALLNQLIAFKDPFGRSAIVGMAPEGMGEMTRIAAFATLRRYRLVQQTSCKRFAIDEVVKNLYPLTDMLKTQHLSFFTRSTNTYVAVWTRLREADLNAAYEWGQKHVPSYGRYLDHKFAHKGLMDEDAHPLMQEVYETAQYLHDRPMQGYILSMWGRSARENKDWVRANEFYQKAVKLYQQIDQQANLIKMCFAQGDSASALNNIAEAQAAYQQVLTLAETRQWKAHETDALWRLQSIALQQGDLETVRNYFQRLMILEHRVSRVWAHTHLRLADVAAVLGEIDIARDFYARAALESPWHEQHSLWAQGKMEYYLANRQEGCKLCRLALLLARRSAERMNLESVQAEFQAWQREYTAMNCPDL